MWVEQACNALQRLHWQVEERAVLVLGTRRHDQCRAEELEAGSREVCLVY